MQATARHLLDVLKETLSHQERIRDLMVKHKQLLIDGKDLDALAVIKEIEEHSQVVVECERDRQAAVVEIAQNSEIEPDSLTVHNLLELPQLLSVREELTTTTTQLRKVLQEIILLRDEVEVLAQHAKAYSDMMLAAFHTAVSKPSNYGGSKSINAAFLSIRT
ncbi:flagellar export chaperone FlgN [Alicyclobacillus dauci]|uniref:Flagellar protein FlgN n=1 Tax=Alicyclobacillus dauci TaxID=1475485 RepID=A0ABY6Z480_9BACL|nr:flagellar export chaperone FlgN [Alicyclobacillus dauci]WAH37684.1 flagellar protein FlgN [Alicyclobacillus dauci]